MKKRVIVVTGGSEGIGYAIAERFLINGDTVIITSRRESEGKEAEKILSALGEVRWIKADVGEEEDCISLVEEIKGAYGKIDVLVNNAGTVGERGDLLQQDMKNIENVLRVNVMGTIHTMKYVGQVMKCQGKGVIINVGSICGIISNPESIAYHASKGAIRMVTQAGARELSPLGIRVLSVAPGWVATPLLQSVIPEESMAHGASLHLQGKVIEPSQIAGAVFILASDEASVINGTTVMSDDGYSSFKL
ncbi:MAG: SDR family NAD(P)-dependent oxidoreductase [Filifactoraceae bacterium]